MAIATVRIHKDSYSKVSTFCRRVSYLSDHRMTQADTLDRIFDMLASLPDDTVYEGLKLDKV